MSPVSLSPSRIQLYSCAGMGSALWPVLLAATCMTCIAQESKPELQLQRVEITAEQGAQERKFASSLKVIVTRDDMERFGDSTLADVLRRVPGVSVVSTGGRAQEIRLRGLGGGYTRIYVNGELMPVGYSIDDLSPNLVERIDIQRTSTADTGAQSMAGSIHVTLRQKPPLQDAPQLKLGLTQDSGIRTGDAGVQFGRRDGPVSQSLAVNLRYDKNRWPSWSVLESRSPSGVPQAANRVQTIEGGERYIVGAVPRFSWKPDDTRNLVLEGLFQWTRLQYQWRQETEVLYGLPPDFSRTHTASDTDTMLAQVSGTLTSRVGEDARLEARVTASVNRRTNHFMVTTFGFESDTDRLLHRTIDSSLRDRILAFSGKYSLTLADDHLVGLGWNGRNGLYDEFRTQHETTDLDYPVRSFNEDYDTTIRQFALYVQDEWTVSRRLSLYLGVRWERLNISIDTNASGSRAETHTSTASPTMQVIWKVPDTKSDQVRINLGRTYKLPTTPELVPRTRVVTFNSAATPNLRGNAQLRPELAWGLDVGYERYLLGDGFVGINAYSRWIKDLILPMTFLEHGQWVSMPVNAGLARTTGVELELKGNLRRLLDTAPPVRFRVGLARHWSRVEQVPGPGNRLREQPWMTYSYGLDHRFADSALTLGGNLTVERAGFIRTSVDQSTDKRDRRLLDVYAAWSPDKTSKWRVSLVNLLKKDSEVRTRFSNDTLNQTQTVISPSYRSLRIVYETSL